MYGRNVIAMMPSCGLKKCKEERSLLSLVLFTAVTYFLVMDIIMFVTLQSTPSIVESKPPADGHYSVFVPITAKSLMSDYITIYIMNPSVEYFDTLTKFSKVFYFITPNMISFSHMFLALVAAKLVSSVNLSTRRFGVLLFFIRTWMDSLDGAVYRNRIGENRIYHSNRSSLGYYIDGVCDGVGGIFVAFGILFYFYKQLDNKPPELPYTKLNENGSDNYNNHVTNSVTQYTKLQLFWKMFCAGFQCAVAAGIWDSSVEGMKSVLEHKFTDSSQQAIQESFLHSFATWFVMWLWKLGDGQALLSFIVWSVVIDKAWEYVNFIQYIGYVFLFSVFIINIFYVKHMKAALNM